MTMASRPATDPVEAAVGVLLKDGGEFGLETDRLNAPETRSRLRVRYDGKDHGRTVLRGLVVAFVGRQGPALDSLGWVRTPLEEMQAPDRGAVEQAEARRQAHGTDYRLGYTRRWDLPPSTQQCVAAELRATLRTFDDRPPNEVRYEVHRDGPLDQGTVGTGMVAGCFSLIAGSLAAGFLVILPRDGGLDLATHAGIAGIVALLAVSTRGGGCSPACPAPGSGAGCPCGSRCWSCPRLR